MHFKKVRGFVGVKYAIGTFEIKTPVIELYCESESCSDTHFFDPKSVVGKCEQNEFNRFFITYCCRHCKTTLKHFALVSRFDDEENIHMIQKLGEFPSFGPITPNRVFKIVGTDREMFLKGRRSESQGLGIAAFAYYRRVVENQKNRIIDEIIGVMRIQNCDSAEIAKFEKAKSEQQFTKSVEIVKDAIPETLRVHGHNPITLLHSALSEGVHNLSDAECLEIAQSIRIILLELSEKIENALKNNAEIKDAVSVLLRKKSASGSPG